MYNVQFILREWKSAPYFKKRLSGMVSCIYLEEIRYTLRGTNHKFLHVWGQATPSELIILDCNNLSALGSKQL